MTRWLWPLLALFLTITSLQALYFDRVNHNDPARKSYSVMSFTTELNRRTDFFVFAVPVAAGGLLGCGLLVWLYAGAHREVRPWAMRFPPVGPEPQGQDRLHTRLEPAVRAVAAVVPLGLGGYTAVHLSRHLLKQGVFFHRTDQPFHGAGLWEHLTHWSLSGDLRYGAPDGVTYYAGVQSTLCLLMVVAGLVFGCWGLLRVLPLRRSKTDGRGNGGQPRRQEKTGRRPRRHGRGAAKAGAAKAATEVQRPRTLPTSAEGADGARRDRRDRPRRRKDHLANE